MGVALPKMASRSTRAATIALLATTATAQTFGCTCSNPTYPCRAWYSATSSLTCWGGTQASCASMCMDGSSPCASNMLGGEFCQHQPCTISHCSACNPEGTICNTCEAGWMPTTPPSGACQSEASFFADVSVQLLPGSGVPSLVPRDREHEQCGVHAHRPQNFTPTVSSTE